jgi:hypothetical protein
VLELVDRTNLRFVDLYHKGSSPFSDREYSLIGKTPILHIGILGSIPYISIINGLEPGG